MQAGKRRTVNKAILEKYPLFKNDPIETITPVASQGHCNLNYRIETTKHAYLLRVFKEKGIDRQREFMLQQKASELGIAPHPLLLELDAGWMITEFVYGAHLESLNGSQMRSLAKVLQKLHTIEADMPPLALHKLVRDHNQRIKYAFDVLESCPKEIVLCHNDLNPKNLLWQEKRVRLIDFEYAAVNDRYFDVAALCTEFGFSKAAQHDFCTCYFQGGYLETKIEAYQIIYRQLCKEWFEGR